LHWLLSTSLQTLQITAEDHIVSTEQLSCADNRFECSCAHAELIGEVLRAGCVELVVPLLTKLRQQQAEGAGQFSLEQSLEQQLLAVRVLLVLTREPGCASESRRVHKLPSAGEAATNDNADPPLVIPLHVGCAAVLEAEGHRPLLDICVLAARTQKQQKQQNQPQLPEARAQHLGQMKLSLTACAVQVLAHLSTPIPIRTARAQSSLTKALVSLRKTAYTTNLNRKTAVEENVPN
jgi:hypothetical protein